jgi:DNA-binding LytR/AlgR family response regulator
METMNANYPACLPNRQGYIKPATEPVIVLPTCKGRMVIPVQQIIRIQSISNYSKLFFSNASPATGGGKSLVVAKVLHWFQEQSALCSFVRVHRTHFVNISSIKNYSGGKTGLLLLHNGEIISVAKRKKAALAEWLNSLNDFFAVESASTSIFNNKKNLAA